MRQIISSLIMLAMAVALSATENIHFRHVTIKDGLSVNQVNSFMRDSKGFMWISTSHGLCRYDGLEFKNFIKDSDSPGGLPFNFVESVQEDADGMLWVSFGKGKWSCYDPVKEQFIGSDAILSDRYGLSGQPEMIFIDDCKDIWIKMTDGAVFHADTRKGKAIGIPNLQKKNLRLTSMCNSPEGVSVIYSDGSFCSVDRKTGAIVSTGGIPATDRTDSQADYSIFCDNDGDYWIFRHNDSWLYRPESDGFIHLTGDKPLLSGNNVKSIISDRHGRIWIAIENCGIDIIDKKTLTVKNLRNDNTNARSLSENSVLSLYNDDEGGIWVGTFKHGISYYNDNLFCFRVDNFNEFKNLKNFNPDVSAIEEDADGGLWLGAQNRIIHVDYVTKRKELIDLPSGQQPVTIIDLMADKKGRLWLSTYNHGLLKYEDNRFSHQLLESDNPNSLANKTIWTVAEDGSGNILIGTWGAGLYSLNPDNGEIRSYNNYDKGFHNSQIASICVSGDNDIYLGTTFWIDVYHPDSDTFEKLTGNRSGTKRFTDSRIVQLFEDSRDLLWICTCEGLNIYDRHNDDVIYPVRELRHAIINGVTEDDDKNMWVTTSEGLYHIIVNSNPHSREYSFSHHRYDSRNSFENLEFNHKCLIKHSSGVIISGGINGINLINPSDIKSDSSLPNVNFTRFQLFNRDIKIDSIYDGVRILDSAPAYAREIMFNYDQNVFSVEFSAMNYISPERLSYLYMLEGFDQDWIKSTSNKLTYTNLAPGTYTLKVKAINHDGHGGDPAELKIVINPPFWRSWTAYVLYFLIFAGIIILIRKYLRHNESQKYELMRIQQEARQKHELDDMKLRFFTNISHDLRTPLTLILTPLEYAMAHTENRDIKDKLEMARHNAMRLLAMVNQLLDFRKSDMRGHNLNAACGNIVDTIRTICDNFIEYSEHRNISLTFFSSAKSLYMMFDQDKINKIMMNLLSNAFKFTPEGGRVDVSVELVKAADGKPETLEIKVADNGCGIADEHKKMIFDRFYQIPRSKGANSAGSGIGLNLVKEFVTLHRGTVSVCDNVGKGAVFIVSIPVVRPDKTGGEEEAAGSGEEAPAMKEIVPEDTLETSGKEAASPKRQSILIVDDNADFRKFMNDCLKEHYDVHEAADGAKAWEMIPNLQPDVIVSDVMMPEMDGNELCRLVKNDIRTSHIPVILLTARAAKEHELKGLENGADDYITKPFNLNILTHRLKNLLALRQDSRRKAMDISPRRIDITPLDEKLMKKAISYVENNMERSDLSVEELAGELGMSRVHLYKKLVAITGKTPVEFIRIIRLKRAAQLLAESQLNIAEVTYQTGFNNLSLFRKYFKNEFGVLPSEYQAKHGKKYNESI